MDARQTRKPGTIKMHFICKFESAKLFGNMSLLLEYSREQLTFPSFQVKYRYQFTSLELLDSWQDRRMTGFNLSWFIKDSNGSQVRHKITLTGSL